MYIYSQMVTIPLGLGFLFYCPQVDFSGITKFQIEGQLIMLVSALFSAYKAKLS